MSPLALAAMVGLLLLNGFFVAAEFAFTAANRHRLERRPGRSARAAVRLIDDLSFTLAGAQLGITIASLLLGAIAEPAVAAGLEAVVETVVEIPDAMLHTISLIISFAIVIYLHMVVGEMAPKNIAIADPDRSSLVMALPFRAYLFALGPVVWLLNTFANSLLRVVGVDPDEIGEAHTMDDLASMITMGRREGVVEEFAHRLLTGAIDLAGLEATHVMVPRPDVVALPRSASLAEVEQTVIEHGYSRIPVYERDLDDVRGFVHAKDLLRVPAAAFSDSVPESLVRPLLVVPESAQVDHLLEQMRRNRNHLALVIDEHGGTAGIVTMEDIVEEVVGEIRDEHDVETEGVRRTSPNWYVVDASLRPAEVERFAGVQLPEGEYDTVSGFVMERIGRIPEVGDRIDEQDWMLRVRSMDGRRVGEVDMMIKRGRERDE